MVYPEFTPYRLQGRFCESNEDTEETRDEYISDALDDFYRWVRRFHAELIDEYIEDNAREYLDWLN